MDRLRRVLRRRTAKVGFVPEDHSRGPGQEHLGPPSREEEGPIQARTWLCSMCWHKKPVLPSAKDPLKQPTTSRCKWRWPWVRPGRREPGGEERRAEEPCSLPPRAPSSLEPGPAAPHAQAAPCRGAEEGPASLGQELSPSCTSPSPSLSCSSSSADSHSSLGSASPPAPGASHTVIPSPAIKKVQDEEEQEKEDQGTQEGAVLSVTQRLQERRKMQHRKDGQCLLQELLTLQAAMQQRGHEAVELQGWKASMPDKIVELMEDVPREEYLGNTIPDIIAAIWCLSDLEMCLDPFLQSRLLRAAASKTFGAIGRNNISNPRMHMGNLEGLLWCLLSSAPSLDRLNFLWEQFTFWMEAVDAQHRALGMRASTTLMSFAALLLPHFEGSPDVPEVGDMAARLGLSISDPEETIGCDAVESLYWLTRILLHQRGRDMRGADEMFGECPLEPSQVQCYRDLARVGEVLREILSEEQKRSFLQRTILAIHHGRMHVKTPALLFLYAILGETSLLIGDKEEEVPGRIVRKLVLMKCCHELPKELQGHSLLACSSGPLSSPLLSSLQQPPGSSCRESS
ncbi:uncharacterized protein LOC132244085 [Alligator mississippiensis]|uniref:uncharacterized protein LOC132244085 n=1 Tax=Alligator mississippiensis TaxID=8496 RepID=UPI0028780F30|nr:uncharacterized protein LOC132244085 [Alligator mississippiensis]XP_059571041.1 uncharacterized protein LOC132244085 [Alligator mississippiensis]